MVVRISKYRNFQLLTVGYPDPVVNLQTIGFFCDSDIIEVLQGDSSI